MTVICALHDTQTNQTVIGSNVGALSGATRIPHSTSTWIVRDTCALGLSGQHRQFEILRHRADDLLKGDASPFDLAQRIRALFHEFDIHGYSRGNDAQNLFGASMILARPDGVWDIDGTLAPCRIDNDVLWARGSGMHFALGAGFAASDRDAFQRVQIAVDAARNFDVDCPGDCFVTALQTARMREAA